MSASYALVTRSCCAVASALKTRGRSTRAEMNDERLPPGSSSLSRRYGTQQAPVLMDTRATPACIPHAYTARVGVPTTKSASQLQPSHPATSRSFSLSRPRRRVTAERDLVHGSVQRCMGTQKFKSAAALTMNCALAATLANVGCRMEDWVVARSEQSHAASTCRQRPPWPRRRRPAPRAQHRRATNAVPPHGAPRFTSGEEDRVRADRHSCVCSAMRVAASCTCARRARERVRPVTRRSHHAQERAAHHSSRPGGHMWGGAPVARGRKSAAGFLLTGCSRPNRPRAGPWGGSGRHATREQATARLGLSPALILTNAHRGARTCTCTSHRARESAGGALAGLAHMLAHPLPTRQRREERVRRRYWWVSMETARHGIWGRGTKL